MPSRLTNLEIVEVSFVDKPANPESRVELFKRDSSGDEEDVKKSIHVNHQKTQPGSEDVMEDEVLGTKKRKKKKKKSADDDQMVVKADGTSYPAIGGTKKEERQMPEDDAPELEFNEEQEEYVRSLEDKAMDLEDAVTKANATIAELQEDDDSDADEDKILKSAEPEVVELVKAARAEAQEANELAKSERGKRIRKEMEDKADQYAALTIEKSDMADFLVSAGEHLPDEDVDKLHTMLAAANEAAAVGKLLEEVGSGGEGPTDAEDKIEKAARVILEKSTDDSLTYEQAYVQALDADPDLYGDVLDEQKAGA